MLETLSKNVTKYEMQMSIGMKKLKTVLRKFSLYSGQSIILVDRSKLRGEISFVPNVSVK